MCNYDQNKMKELRWCAVGTMDARKMSSKNLDDKFKKMDMRWDSSMGSCYIKRKEGNTITYGYAKPKDVAKVCGSDKYTYCCPAINTKACNAPDGYSTYLGIPEELPPVVRG
jgi:hypothetical protein